MERTIATYATPEGEKTEEFSWSKDESAISPDDIDIESWAPTSASKPKELSNTGSREFTILKLESIPQFKTEYETRTIARIFGRRIRTKIPRAYRRYATKKIVAVVTYPQSLEAQAVSDVEECGKIAAAAAVAGAMVQGPQGALVAFNGSFQVCILAKLGDKASQLGTDVRSETEHSEWTPY